MTVVHDFRGRESEIVLLLLSLFTFSPSSTKDGALLHCVIFFLYWLSSRDGFFFSSSDGCVTEPHYLLMLSEPD